MQSKSIVASNDTGTLSENECPSSLPFLAFLLYQECTVPLYGVTRTRTSNPVCPVFLMAGPSLVLIPSLAIGA